MRQLILALGIALATNAWAGIGQVADTKGTACEITRGKNKLTGAKGADIESMDTYTTGACTANITFRDDTKVRVTENSRLLIDDFVFDPKKSDAGKLAMKVGMGTVRYASGQIAKNNPQQVNIKTPSATIAVRGTDFNMTVDEAGQSLVILVPSCKDERDIKQYELEENRCKVGKIEVSTGIGTVVLDQAFEATYVVSFSQPPTPPVIVNTVEAKINNNLILAKPQEVQRAIKDSGKSKREELEEELEAEAARRLASMVKESASKEKTVVSEFRFVDGKPNCNPTANICVRWEQPDQADIQSRGRGTAFRTSEEHYAEVKTTGYQSNTTISITHNDNFAYTVIGSGEPGGNIVNIRQNNGVLRPR